MSADELRIRYLAGDWDADTEAEAALWEGVSVQDLAALKASLSDASAWEEPGDSVLDSILGTIAAEASGEASGEVPPVVSAAPADAAPAGVVELSTWKRRARVWTGVAAGLAAAVVALALVVVLRDNPVVEQEPRGERLGAAQLTGTELRPGVTGDATFTDSQSGIAIHLDAPGLERAPEEYFYEAWLKSDDPTKGLVPIGTFHTGKDVVLWAGVPLDEYQSITVTLEPEDGNQASSGQRARVLTGPIVRR